MSIRLKNNNTIVHDIIFLISVAILFLVVIPIFFRIKEYFDIAKKETIKDMCMIYSLPSYHIETSKYNAIRKIILEKRLIELNLFTEEKMSLILNKIRFDSVEKRITKSKRNFIITIFSVTLITSYITKFIEAFLVMLEETKLLYSSNYQFFIFRVISIILILIIIISMNNVFNMAVEALEDLDKLRKYSYLFELEGIINEKLIEVTK